MEGICQVCGELRKIDKHHIDYEKNLLLDVCRRCHNKIHALLNSIKKPLTKPIKLTCQRCDKEWTYKGRNPFYATCPDCKTSVKIQEVEIK